MPYCVEDFVTRGNARLGRNEQAHRVKSFCYFCVSPIGRFLIILLSLSSGSVVGSKDCKLGLTCLVVMGNSGVVEAVLFCDLSNM